jgi:response regulator RpfG family c-di-GMP phosphodiesterase
MFSKSDNFILYIINNDKKMNIKIKNFLNKNNLNNIMIFENDEKAIKNIKNGNIPDIILIDSNLLKNGGGIEASQRIKFINNNITIICVASGDKDNITLPLQILAGGCDDWLSITNSLEFYLNKIQEWLKIKQKQLQIKELFDDRRKNKRMNAITILEAGLL